METKNEPENPLIATPREGDDVIVKLTKPAWQLLAGVIFDQYAQIRQEMGEAVARRDANRYVPGDLERLNLCESGCDDVLEIYRAGYNAHGGAPELMREGRELDPEMIGKYGDHKQSAGYHDEMIRLEAAEEAAIDALEDIE